MAPRRQDKLFLVVPLMLSFIGFLFIYSATHGQSEGPSPYVHKQLLAVLLGCVIFVVVGLSDYRFWKDTHWVWYGLGLALLVGVLLMGKTAQGAQRWIPLGSFAFQPSEFGKAALLLTLACLLAREERRGYDVPKSLGLTAIPLLLVFVQPDLGTAIVFAVLWASLAFFAGVSVRWFAGLGLAGAAASPLLWIGLKDYQKERLLVFLNPEKDPLGAAYHLIQSKIAIGSGGLFGKGFMSGTQSQLHFIPGLHTDFIFAVIAEEAGLFGVLVILTLFSLLIFRALALTAVLADPFGRLLCAGVAALWTFQLFENVGMTMGLLPITGIPLPFLSYGGTSLLLHFFLAGLLFQLSAWKGPSL